MREPIDPSNYEQASDVLCAAISQMRGDGGVAFTGSRRVFRTSTVSPFRADPIYRNVFRNPVNESDEWDKKLWPNGYANDFNVDALAESVKWQDGERHPEFVEERARKEGQTYVTYALMRGLCALRPPTTKAAISDKSLPYNTPSSAFATNAAKRYKQETDPPSLKFDNELYMLDRALFCQNGISAQADITLVDDRNYLQDTKPALWAPVENKQAANNEHVWVRRFGETEEAMAKCVFLEQLVDTMKKGVTDLKEEPDKRLQALGVTALAKLEQLPSMALIFGKSVKERQEICKPIKSINRKQETQHFFWTRPVQVRTSKDDQRDNVTLYSCDPGLASYKCQISAPTGSSPSDSSLPATSSTLNQPADDKYYTHGFGRVLQGSVEGELHRSRFKLGEANDVLRDLLPCSGKKTSPVYVAPPETWPAELGDNNLIAYLNNLSNREPRVIAHDIFPADDEIPDLKSIIAKGLQQCQELGRLECHAKHIAQLQEDEEKRKVDSCQSGDADDLARTRRNAVWNDAQREAAIAGDRLYAFVRQLSGTISENVDSVCQIDEGMLVRQQQQVQERRARIADRAAQEHMQLVRGVFTAVLRESGLALSIGTADPNGDIGQLKVVSNSFRKQLQEQAQGGDGGLFSNAVRLEQLLRTGTGEMTLTDLFERLRVAGIELQTAALAVPTVTSAAGPSLDFLSAPRNSLVLRYKPEALAAMRQAFDIFQRELAVGHGLMYRTISAYELIEGNDDTLCAAFAQFTAHMLVHSRMYSNATAMYVAAWPAAANAQQLRISLQRLVRAARVYLSNTATPAFLSESGRRNYFARSRSSSMGSGMIPLVHHMH